MARAARARRWLQIPRPNAGADGEAGVGASPPQPSVLEGGSPSSSCSGPGRRAILPNSLVPPGGLPNLFNRGVRPKKSEGRKKSGIGRLIRGKHKVSMEKDVVAPVLVSFKKWRSSGSKSLLLSWFFN